MPASPTANALFICDDHIAVRKGKVDLYGLFNAIRAPKGFPHDTSRFCLFAQLVNGLGPVEFRFDFRFAETDELVHRTETHSVMFPDRMKSVYVALEVRDVSFPYPGVYVVELLYENTWVCDTRLTLYE